MPLRIQPLALENYTLFLCLTPENLHHRRQPLLPVGLARIAVAALVSFIMPLQFFAGLEANGLPGRDRDFLASARVAAHTPFARLDDKDSEPTQLYSLAARQRFFHRVKERVDSLLSFHLWYAGALSHAIDDV